MPGKPDPKVGWEGTTNSRPHQVWLPRAARKIIAGLGDEAAIGFVFAGTRGYGLADAMRKLCARLGIARLTPHDLRRTHGSTITGLGFGRAAMNRVQNHKEGGIADVYDVHDYAPENKRVMEAVAERIVAIAEGRAPADNVVPLAR